jgi:hypothetical protein
VWNPHPPNRDVIQGFVDNIAKHWGHHSHTFVCVKCFIKYLHNKGEVHGKERKEVNLFFHGVPSAETGVCKVKCRMREFTVNAAMCWGQAPFLRIPTGDSQPSVCGPTKPGIVGDQSFGWRVCGTGDLSFAFFSI